MSNALTSSAAQQALQYFQAPRGYFWRWADSGQIVEWQNSITICYREELHAILATMAPAGLPPLGAVLLLLAACSEGWPESDGRGILQVTAKNLIKPESPDKLGFYINQVLRFLDIVHALPPEMRTGPRKLHLFREVFQTLSGKTGPTSLGVVLNVLQVRSQQSVEGWASGRLDLPLQAPGPVASGEYFLADLWSLDQAFQRFPSTDLLALRLRTGLDALPAPLPELELPTPQPPEVPADLLDQLAQDRRTAAVARLTQQLVAALRIPMHTHKASEQPLGGIADVTNRGNFDRLLLSELAHDDLTLMARLVNHEALYLRREAPPRSEARPRTILLDTTLRMWGMPRVFALAAALAWMRNSRQARPPAPVRAYALAGQYADELDLESLDGVVEALDRLDAALHGGLALREFVRRQYQAPATDCLLITTAELLSDPGFALALTESKAALRFLLAVHRSGELQLFEFQNGHRALLSTSRFDLEAVLFAPAPRRAPAPLTLTEGPAFLLESPAPLFFPTTGLRVTVKNTFYHRSLGVLSITDTQRLLYWPSRSTGAREVLPVIAPGSYHFGTNGTTHIYLLISGPEVLHVHLFDTEALRVESVDIWDELTGSEEPTQVVFKDECFYVQRRGSKMFFGCLEFDCQQGQVTGRNPAYLPEADSSGFRPDFGQIKRHINNGYTTLHRVSRIDVNAQGELLLEGHTLRLVSQNLALLPKLPEPARVTAPAASAHYIDNMPLGGNELVRLRRFRWADGSEAVVDSRGLLHLRSSDPGQPEITLVLILGRTLAAWAADGSVCGPSYFTGPAQVLSAAGFYHQYLQRFIDRLT
jgi:hypothetical protein